MEEDEEGFLYPVVKKIDCINCHKCEKVCPILNHKQEQSDLKVCFAAYNKNASDRELSSSGGIFIALARKVIESKGVVFGSALNNDLCACHEMASSLQELARLVGSKYMESILANTFVSVEGELKKGKLVLFCGTTCQVGGLKAYLGEKYDNLICVDFICMGVPSPKIWKDYVKTYFNLENINWVNFKDKSNGWHHFSLRIENKQTEPIIEIGANTYYFSGYFKGLYSRPSCHVCEFKYDSNRISDITISDCWGSESIAPEMDDNKGLSSIICHSQKGLDLFNDIKNDLVWKDASISDVEKYNSGYCIPRQAGNKRNAFWEDYKKQTAKKVFEKYCKPERKSFVHSVVGKIKQLKHLQNSRNKIEKRE
jgi:hypothetical protein